MSFQPGVMPRVKLLNRLDTSLSHLFQEYNGDSEGLAAGAEFFPGISRLS
jgi:hypothetical protein